MSVRQDPTAPHAMVLAAGDNIGVALCEIPPGTRLSVAGRDVEVSAFLDVGHKFAVRAIAAGERVVKYGAPIGRATRDIAPGEYVHLHNLESEYIPTYTLEAGRRYGEEERE